MEYDDVKDAIAYHSRLAKAEGIAETKRQIAAEMLKACIDPYIITQTTGLTEEEITMLSSQK